MRKHDLELISALAEGTLEDETEARALIDSSPSLRAEYEAQVAALEALRASGSAQLTDQERSSLRRDVWSELRSPVAAVSSRTPWYARWSTAAAALALVIGGAVVVNQQAATQETSADLASGLADPAATQAGEAESSDGADSSREELAFDDAAAPLAEVDADLYRHFADELRSGGDISGYEASPEFLARGDTHSECLAEAGLEDHVVVGEIKPPAGPLIFAASPIDDPDIGTPISFIASTTCEVVYIAD